MSIISVIRKGLSENLKHRNFKVKMACLMAPNKLKKAQVSKLKLQFPILGHRNVQRFSLKIYCSEIYIDKYYQISFLYSQSTVTDATQYIHV